MVIFCLNRYTTSIRTWENIHETRRYPITFRVTSSQTRAKPRLQTLYAFVEQVSVINSFHTTGRIRFDHSDKCHRLFTDNTSHRVCLIAPPVTIANCRWVFKFQLRKFPFSVLCFHFSSQNLAPNNCSLEHFASNCFLVYVWLFVDSLICLQFDKIIKHLDYISTI